MLEKQQNTGLMTQQEMAEVMDKVLLTGDLSKLEPADRIKYYNATCQSMNLNPLTKPFEYMSLSGKMVLYATKNCAEQIRNNKGISITKLEKSIEGDLLTVTAHATDSLGRTDVATGAVWLGTEKGTLKGELLANAFMKAETKAKRRVTLSLAGLGMLDESEVETIPNVKYENYPEIDNSAISTAFAKYSYMIEEAKDAEQLKAIFAEGWQALKKLNATEEANNLHKLCSEKNKNLTKKPKKDNDEDNKSLGEEEVERLYNVKI